MNKPILTAESPSNAAAMNSRRQFLQQGGVGLGAIALNWIVQQDQAKAAAGQLAIPDQSPNDLPWPTFLREVVLAPSEVDANALELYSSLYVLLHLLKYGPIPDAIS